MLLWIAARAALADSCSVDGPGLDPRLDGAVDVPVDSVLWYSLGDGDAFEAILLDESGAEVPASGQPLRPETALQPGAQYTFQLIGWDGYSMDAADFTTGDGATPAPAAPVIVGLTFGARKELALGPCGETGSAREVTVDVEVPESDPLAWLSLTGELYVPGFAVPAPAPGVHPFTGVTAVEDGQELCVGVALASGAGEATEAEVFCDTVSGKGGGGGCSSTPGGPTGAWILPLLALGLAVRWRTEARWATATTTRPCPPRWTPM